MSDSVILSNREVVYTVRMSARARRESITLYPDGRLVVTIPKRTAKRTDAEHLTRRAARLIKEKRNWILRQLSRITAREYAIVPDVPHKRRKDAYRRARALIEARITHFNASLGFSFNTIRIKNHKTQWGSCSSKGNLNFNYRLIHLPRRLVDYVIVHELCHLAELNHSPRFKEKLAAILPDWHAREQELKRYQLL